MTLKTHMLSRKPIVIDEDNFYYEQLNGLRVIHRKGGSAEEIRIPWHFVLSSAKHKIKLDRQWRVRKVRNVNG